MTPKKQPESRATRAINYLKPSGLRDLITTVLSAVIVLLVIVSYIFDIGKELPEPVWALIGMAITWLFQHGKNGNGTTKK